MIKADRYTQDGREELIKAQEAVTEDVTYKPGDISRKTGLQKQPDGSWAPVKNAPGNKKPDGKSGSSEKHSKAMAHAEKVGVVSEVPTGWKKAEGVTTTPNGYVAITNGASLFPKEGEAKREIKFIKQEDFDKSASGSAPSRSSQSLEEFLHGNEPTPGSIMRDQQQKIMDANDNKVIIKRNHGMISLYGAKNGVHIADFQTEKERLDFMKKYNLSKPDSNSVTPALIGGEKTIKRYKDLYDSAPRQLTGDCKVRIKKSK